MGISSKLRSWWFDLALVWDYLVFAWSPIDSRTAVAGFGPGTNTGVVDGQGNTNYSLPGSQTSSNRFVPGTDSRTGRAPKDSRVNVPQNSRSPQN
jgi:hypothetical protein